MASESRSRHQGISSCVETPESLGSELLRDEQWENASMSAESVQNFVLTGVALLGAWIAWSGLTTWKKQLRGTHEFELARRLLLSVYKVRDGARNVRRPFLASSEADDPSSESWKVSAYQNRWKVVDEGFRELRLASLEAETVWGRDILDEENKALRQHLNQLLLAIIDKLHDDDQTDNDELFTRDDFEVLYVRGVEDGYSRKLDKIVDSFDEVTRPKLSG